MAESIRLLGAMALASPCTSPYIFALPGADVKSSISLFKRKPAPVTVTPLPKPPFNVVVTAAALPWASTTE